MALKSPTYAERYLLSLRVLKGFHTFHFPYRSGFFFTRELVLPVFEYPQQVQPHLYQYQDCSGSSHLFSGFVFGSIFFSLLLFRLLDTPFHVPPSLPLLTYICCIFILLALSRLFLRRFVVSGLNSTRLFCTRPFYYGFYLARLILISQIFVNFSRILFIRPRLILLGFLGIKTYCLRLFGAGSFASASFAAGSFASDSFISSWSPRLLSRQTFFQQRLQRDIPLSSLSRLSNI